MKSPSTPFVVEPGASSEFGSVATLVLVFFGESTPSGRSEPAARLLPLLGVFGVAGPPFVADTPPRFLAAFFGVAGPGVGLAS